MHHISRRLLQLLKLLFWASVSLHLPYLALGLLDGIVHFPAAAAWARVALQRVHQSPTRSFYANILADLGELTMEPYGVPKITTHVEWWERLGILRDDIPYEGGSYRQLWGQNSLVRLASRRDEGRAWHQWVYLAGGDGHATGSRDTHEWNDAFDELVQYHAVHPAAHDARFSYVACPGNDLCVLWGTRAPALVHFTTALPEEKYETQRDGRYLGPEYVYMRTIELPISTKARRHPPFASGALQLPPNVFPSPFHQMLSVTGNPDAWKDWDPQYPSPRILALCRLLSSAQVTERPWLYGLLFRLDRQVLPKEWGYKPMNRNVYTAGWLTTFSAGYMMLAGPTSYADLVRETYRGLFQREASFADPMGPAVYELEGDQAKAMEDIVVTFLSCDGDVGKMRAIPEVRAIIDKLRASLSKTSKQSIDERLQSAGKEGCDMNQTIQGLKSPT